MAKSLWHSGTVARCRSRQARALTVGLLVSHGQLSLRLSLAAAGRRAAAAGRPARKRPAAGRAAAIAGDCQKASLRLARGQWLWAASASDWQ